MDSVKTFAVLAIADVSREPGETHAKLWPTLAKLQAAAMVGPARALAL